VGSRAIKIKLFFNTSEEYDSFLSKIKASYIVVRYSRPLLNDRSEHRYLGIVDLEEL
jgi:hypothetical protein